MENWLDPRLGENLTHEYLGHVRFHSRRRVLALEGFARISETVVELVALSWSSHAMEEKKRKQANAK